VTFPEERLTVCSGSSVKVAEYTLILRGEFQRLRNVPRSKATVADALTFVFFIRWPGTDKLLVQGGGFFQNTASVPAYTPSMGCDGRFPVTSQGKNVVKAEPKSRVAVLKTSPPKHWSLSISRATDVTVRPGFNERVVAVAPGA
jgi:hypothetical protein